MNTLVFTKYEQDCFSIRISETESYVFDVGSEASVDKILTTQKPKAAFISHSHPDHFNVEKLKLLKCPIYGPIEVISVLQQEGLQVTEIFHNTSIKFDSLEVLPFNVDHGAISAPIVNLGFLIKTIGRNILFLGDIANPSPIPEEKFDLMLIPVGGSKVFDVNKAFDFIKSIGYSGNVIPIHYHGRADRNSCLQFKAIASSHCNVIILDVNESMEI